MRMRGVFPVILSSCWLASCDVDPDGLGRHDCDENPQYSSNWPLGDIEIDHTDPRKCPHPITAVGEKLLAAGTVRDSTMSYSVSSLEMLNSDTEQLGFREEVFQAAPNHWYASMSMEIKAATGSIWQYDIADYSIAKSGNVADASLHITYQFEDCPDCV